MRAGLKGDYCVIFYVPSKFRWYCFYHLKPREDAIKGAEAMRKSGIELVKVDYGPCKLSQAPGHLRRKVQRMLEGKNIERFE